jgi:uncharacterized protein YndB with AHSA1/START domain
MAGSGETTLHVRRTFQAPREEIFRAWTEADRMSRWLGRGSDQHESTVLELDLRVGGRYRVEIRSPEGKRYVVTGLYREITPPAKLVFTWSWESDPDFGETLVTVELEERAGATELLLTHELFRTEEARASHAEGWSACLETLVRELRT